jgi:hypothetical protein
VLFSLLDAMAFTPLPFQEDESLVYIGAGAAETPAYREHQTSFEGRRRCCHPKTRVQQNGSGRVRA